MKLVPHSPYCPVNRQCQRKKTQMKTDYRLVRTKNNYFQGCAPLLGSKQLLPKKVSTKLGSTEIIFIDRCALIFREHFVQEKGQENKK